MSVLMTMSFRPRDDAAAQSPSANQAPDGNQVSGNNAGGQAGPAGNVWRDQSFAQAMRASGNAPTQTAGTTAATTPGPLVGPADAAIGTLAGNLARTLAEAPAPDSPTQMNMLNSLSRHIAQQEAAGFMPAPARSDYVLEREGAQSDDAAPSAPDPAPAPPPQPPRNARTATRPPTQETIPHLAPGHRAIFAADGHLTPHANPDLIDVFKHAVEVNNDWSRVRMSAPPDRAAFRSLGEPGANDRGPVTPETERVVRDHLQQEHDIDLQSLPVRQMMIDDLFDTNQQLTLMNDILEKIVDEVAAKSPLPPTDIDRLRFVRESEVLARGFLDDIIQHFMNRPREE